MAEDSINIFKYFSYHLVTSSLTLSGIKVMGKIISSSAYSLYYTPIIDEDRKNPGIDTFNHFYKKSDCK